MATWVDYVVVAAPGRPFEVGTGVFAWGRPRGTRATYTGEAKLTAYGMGALHIRSADGGEPFKICATSEKLSPITIIDVEF